MSQIQRLLITGATGCVGSHVAERAAACGIPTVALVRADSQTDRLRAWNVELIPGDLLDPASLARAVDGVTHVVHCAAKVGDWGPLDEFRAVNVRSLAHLLEACERTGRVQRFVHLSSLGVYEAKDHHGTDETVEPSVSGLDGYTLSKIEAEQLVRRAIQANRIAAVILRPGFIYGPRDRTVLPKLLQRLKRRQVKYFGSGQQLLNNTYVGNLVDAIWLALEHPQAVGELFNITDTPLVSKRQFIETVARLAGYPLPTGAVPLGIARRLATISEAVYRWCGSKEAPLVSKARYKFLGLNLDFSIEKARRVLGYEPRVPFETAMQQTIDWFRTEHLLP